MCSSSSTMQTRAMQACQAVYGTCYAGGCGSFSYYYGAGHANCDCNKAVGQYEFVYSNTGYQWVGQAYGNNNGDVSGDGSFVQMKASAGCGSTSWSLTLKDFGVSLTPPPPSPTRCKTGASGSSGNPNHVQPYSPCATL